MKLIEHYEELIERHSSEVSFAWKASIIIMCLLCFVSSYTCAIAFHYFWVYVSGGHCFFWATVELNQKVVQKSSWNSKTIWKFLMNETLIDEHSDWHQNIYVVYPLRNHCKWFLFVCMLSFAVAIIVTVLFAMCGRGGYNASLFFAPWRIVIPTLIICLTMMIITLHSVQHLSYGFLHFSDSLCELANKLLESKENVLRYQRACEAFQTFTKVYNLYDYDSCGLYSTVEASAWIMAWGWIANFFILSLRILMSADFSLLKVRIYEIPQNKRDRRMIIEKVYEVNMISAADRTHLKKDSFDEYAKRKKVL